MDSFLEYAVRASLVSLLDKRVLVVLRDDRKYIGFLR
jgi:small nuclear ribonucleoprotein (snRNP)-like protein